MHTPTSYTHPHSFLSPPSGTYPILPYTHTPIHSCSYPLTIGSGHSDEWEGEQAAVELLQVCQELNQLLSIHSHYESKVEAQGVVPAL